MGKYTALRHKLPAFEQPSEWLDKVNAYKLEFLGTARGEDANPALIAREYADRDAAKRKLEDAISLLNIELEALSQLGVESLEENNMQKIDLSTGGYVSIKDTPYSSIDDRDKALIWVKKNAPAVLTVNFQTLNGMNNERLVAGKPPIPGTKIFLKTKLAVRGVNGSNED